MILIPIIQTLIFFTYLIFVWKKLGVRPSISDSWYDLPKNRRYLFNIFTFGIGLPMLALGTGYYFFAGAFICFVGVAAGFREKLTVTVHVIGAVGGIFLALAGLAKEEIWGPAVVFILLSFIFRIFKIKNATWWLEIIAFILIEIGLFYKFI